MFNHLTLRNRVSIQALIEAQPNISARTLAFKIGVHPSTIYREIKRHRINKGSKNVKFMRRIAVPCSLLERFPFVCNTCDYKPKCTKNIYLYDAYVAHDNAQSLLKDARSEPSLSPLQMKQLDEKVSPRVKCHQSLYHILNSDDSIQVSQSTLRRYIDRQYLTCRNIDLPRTVRFRVQKPKKPRRDKRIDISILINRTYDDYLDYCATLDRVTLQVDLVIGKASDKKALLTIYEPTTRFMWGYMVYRTAESVNNIFKKLIRDLTLKNALFFDSILVDNGAEFKTLPQLESLDTLLQPIRIFYCDPYSSYQRAGGERNHGLVRYLLTKGTSLDKLNQEEIEVMFSHICSLKRESLKGNTAYEMFTTTFQLNPSELFNIQRIKANQVKLK